MQTSAFEYKCRRCGEVYEVLAQGCDMPPQLHVGWEGDVRIAVSYDDCRGGKIGTSDRLKPLDIHACPASGHGISDLIGITPPREEGE